jgi:hypothetical protein
MSISIPTRTLFLIPIPIRIPVYTLVIIFIPISILTTIPSFISTLSTTLTRLAIPTPRHSHSYSHISHINGGSSNG